VLAIGNEELARLPKLGKTIKCFRCGKRHKVKYGDRILEDGSKVKSNTLAFVDCKGKQYLVGIDGKNITSLLKHNEDE